MSDDFLFFDEPNDTDDKIDLNECRCSASGLKDFGVCPYRFKLARVVKAEPTHKDFTYVWVGTLVHTVTYYSIADPTEDGWNVTGIKPISEVKRLFKLLTDQKSYDVDIVQTLIKSKVIADEIPELSRPVNDNTLLSLDIPNQEKWYKLAWDMIKNGYEIITNLYSSEETDSVQLEVPLEFKAFGANFIGYIDILVRNKDGSLKFLDLKTSRRPITKPGLDIQFFLYRVGLKVAYELNYFPVGYYVYLRKAKLFAADEPMEEVYKQVYPVIQKYLDDISKGKFLRNLGSPLCNYCPFRGYCYAGEEVPVLPDVLESNMKLPERVDETIPVFEEDL